LQNVFCYRISSKFNIRGYWLNSNHFKKMFVTVNQLNIDFIKTIVQVTLLGTSTLPPGTKRFPLYYPLDGKRTISNASTERYRKPNFRCKRHKKIWSCWPTRYREYREIEYIQLFIVLVTMFTPWWCSLRLSIIFWLEKILNNM